MQKEQTSRRGGIQDLLCPFEYVKITQGAGVGSKVRINGVFRVDEAYGPSGEYANGKIGCYATCYEIGRAHV